MKVLRTLSCILTLALAACGSVEDISGDSGGPAVPIEVKPGAGKDLYGQITDQDGKPIKGVIVSDGTNSVVTNAYGIYQMKRAENAGFVYYSTPWNYEIETEEGSSIAKFYERIPADAGVHRQDFVLRKRSPEVSEFAILGIGDPQVRIPRDFERFTGETMPRLQRVVGELDRPTIALALGDIVEDTEVWMDDMKAQLGKLGVPVFATIGNHDYLRWEGESNRVRTSEPHTRRWGPLDYSFSVGNMFFICMNSIQFSNGSDSNEEFTPQQIAWLEKHISTVSKGMTVVLFTHSPIGVTGSSGRSVMTLLSKFRDVHAMTGHSHRQQNAENASPAYYDHVHGTVCGAWWWSKQAPDGTPQGFSVYEVEGGSFKNWYFQPTLHDRNYQLRLYRGDTVWTGEGGEQVFTFGKGDDVILANVFNADSKWSVEVYENEVLSGKMSLLPETYDMWARAIHDGNSWIGNRYLTTFPRCPHMYQYKLKDKTAAVKVVATDRFGVSYTATEFEDTDLSGEITSPRP